MQDSLSTFIFGWVLIVFSFPVLWFNESRNAKMESLLARGKSQCRTVSGRTAENENRNWLVHLQGEQARSSAKVTDPQFKVAFDDNCVRLQSVVEVYQYIQHEKKEEKERLGGGKDTITTYTYTTEWSSAWHDSGGYEDRRKANSKPEGLELGHRTTQCARVELGEAFVLSDELVQQCCEFTSAAPRLAASVKHHSGVSFEKQGDGTFYYRSHSSGSQEATRVGDARVRFQYVPDGPVSVLGLQVEKPGDERDSFLPYRLVAKGWCGSMSEDEEKRALRNAGELSKSDLAAQAMVGSGCLSCLCCACNLVNMCCSSMLTPEIYHLLPGSKNADYCFNVVKSRMRAMVWMLRLVGWLMLFIGLYSLFSPFLTFIKVIPFLGPILSSLGGWLIWVMCFVVTLAIASIVICLAYLIYHPLMALLYGIASAAIIAVPLIIIKACH